MDPQSIIRRGLAEHLRTIELLRESLQEAIRQAGELIAQRLAAGGTVFWCGNGGSAADSQHLAAELVGRFKKDRRPLRSVALTTDSSVLTCVSNDYSYAEIFARQIEALGRPQDVLVGISTSGNSDNVLRAILMANKLGMPTVALLGNDGGATREHANHAIVVPSQSTARIQEAHIVIGHLLCEVIERELGLD